MNNTKTTQAIKPLEIKLLHKILKINCPADQQEQLLLAAELLEERLQALQQQDAMWNRDDMLAVTALNLMSEILALNNQTKLPNKSTDNTIVNQECSEQLNTLIKKITQECCN